ncbi:MAG: hypothetical protein U5L45_19790 [Saprospiraceae bacterium]|nr:hypothetical protein [Saprospiraceae bacterium]
MERKKTFKSSVNFSPPSIGIVNIFTCIYNYIEFVKKNWASPKLIAYYLFAHTALCVQSVVPPSLTA